MTQIAMATTIFRQSWGRRIARTPATAAVHAAVIHQGSRAGRLVSHATGRALIANCTTTAAADSATNGTRETRFLREVLPLTISDSANSRDTRKPDSFETSATRNRKMLSV